MSAIPKPVRVPRAPKRIARSSRPRKLSKGPAAGATRSKDAVWRATVKAGETCARCSDRPATDAHHIFGKKAHPNLRHEFVNGVPLCRAHHTGPGPLSAHAHPRAFREWFAAAFPGRWAALEALKQEKA